MENNAGTYLVFPDTAERKKAGLYAKEIILYCLYSKPLYALISYY
jgi:hypothetical protein